MSEEWIAEGNLVGTPIPDGSGDCGFWNPEDEPEVKACRAALAKARGTP